MRSWTSAKSKGSSEPNRSKIGSVTWDQVKLIAATDEDRKGLSVFNYKLIGIVEGGENMYASLIDQDGEILTLSLFEELSPGVWLIALDTKEVVFEREEDSLVVINFKNQIIERDK